MEEPGPHAVALLTAAASFVFSLAESALVNYSPPRFLELARKKKRDSGYVAFIDADQMILMTCRSLAIVSIVAFALSVLAWVLEGRESSTWLYVEAGNPSRGFAGKAKYSQDSVRPVIFQKGQFFLDTFVETLRVLKP